MTDGGRFQNWQNRLKWSRVDINSALRRKYQQARVDTGRHPRNDKALSLSTSKAKLNPVYTTDRHKDKNQNSQSANQLGRLQTGPNPDMRRSHPSLTTEDSKTDV